MGDEFGLGGPLFQIFMGLLERTPVDLVNSFILLGFFNLYYRAIMVGESCKGATYEDEHVQLKNTKI